MSLRPWQAAGHGSLPLLTVDVLTGGLSHGDFRSISRWLSIPRPILILRPDRGTLSDTATRSGRYVVQPIHSPKDMDSLDRIVGMAIMPPVLGRSHRSCDPSRSGHSILIPRSTIDPGDRSAIDPADTILRLMPATDPHRTSPNMVFSRFLIANPNDWPLFMFGPGQRLWINR